MKKYKTSDGYFVYKIYKEQNDYYLADKKNYAKDIEKLIENMSEVKHDSVIFIFGIDTGCYLEALKKQLCIKNRVYIIEPNWYIYQKSIQLATDQIQILFFEEGMIKKLFKQTVNGFNFNTIYFHAFGNYSSIYKKEYDYLIGQLDSAYLDATIYIGLAERFREEFIRNLIANLPVINQAVPIQKYFVTNRNVPAIVVSAGPSLDRNISEIEKHKDKLKNVFIISGSRTVAALTEHGIKPDMIVSIDPVDANYEMMKHNLNLDVPLAFYEYSNRHLLREYQGSKIYLPTLLPQVEESCKNMPGVYFGGSVAHTCIDIAVKLGCNPIILAGQDLAYTDNKLHADNATYDYDKHLDNKTTIRVKSVLGEWINTSATLDHYRRGIEDYISFIKNNVGRDFINCSYGAEIKGAFHEELESIFEKDIFKEEKSCPVLTGTVIINENEIINSIFSFIEDSIKGADMAITLCENIMNENRNKCLMDLENDDIDLQMMYRILNIANEFQTSKMNHYLGGFYNKFLYDNKQTLFTMYAKDYEKQTSDLQYQAKTFNKHFIVMKQMLNEVRKLILETINEFPV